MKKQFTSGWLPLRHVSACLQATFCTGSIRRFVQAGVQFQTERWPDAFTDPARHGQSFTPGCFALISTTIY